MAITMGQRRTKLKNIVLFSGGAASSYVAKLVIDEIGKENVTLLFHDTKAEHADAYRFREQISNFLDVPITEISDGRSLWDVIIDNHCLPSNFIPFCTRILKQNPGERYLKAIQKSGETYTLYNGFGMEEYRRIQKAVVNAEAKGYQVKSPLFDLRISSQQVKDIIRNEWKICLPQPYLYLDHNNCIPCFKGGKKYFRKVMTYYPKEFQQAIDMENLIGHTVFKDYSLTELKSRWKNDMFTDEDFLEDNIPCLCAL